MLISILISIINESQWCVTLEPLYRFWCVTHEIAVEFRVDFKSGVRNIIFPIAKKLIFLPYANLCKLGEYIGDLYGHYAEPPKDQVCQVWFCWHNLLGFGGTNSHQRTPSHELTHLFRGRHTTISYLHKGLRVRGKTTIFPNFNFFAMRVVFHLYWSKAFTIWPEWARSVDVDCI